MKINSNNTDTSYNNYKKKNNDSIIELTEEQIVEFHEAFETFDRNGNGSISTKEISAVMRKLGQNPSEEELKEIIYQYDDDGSGTINFEEFLNLISNKIKESHIEDQLKSAFKTFDRDGNGLISSHELRYLIDSSNAKLSDQDIEEMINNADKDGDGYINYKEFVNMMLSQ